MSRRALTREQARQMVAVRLARSAFREFRKMCFWSCPDDLKVTGSNAAWVVDQLRRNGDRAALQAAGRIQSLLVGDGKFPVRASPASPVAPGRPTSAKPERPTAPSSRAQRARKER